MKNSLTVVIGMLLVLVSTASTNPPPAPPIGSNIYLAEYEGDCTKFWEWDGYMWRERDCPLGLGFDPTLLTCSYKENIENCDDSENGSTNDNCKWRLYQRYESTTQTTYTAFPPFVSVTTIAGHRATCSNDGNKKPCSNVVHSVRPGNTCADCDTYLRDCNCN